MVAMEEGTVRDFRKSCILYYIKNGQPTRTYYIAHGTLLNVTCQPDWEGALGRIDICVCMAESLHCSPETTTASSISYAPTQIKNLKCGGKRGLPTSILKLYLE